MVQPTLHLRKSGPVPVTVHLAIERYGGEIELAIEADHDPGDAPQFGIGPSDPRYDDPGGSPATSITGIFDKTGSGWAGAFTFEENQTIHELAAVAAAEYIRSGGY